MITDSFRLDGKVALVTGASRGIGRAIAQALGEAGARVVTSSRGEDPDGLARLRAAGIEARHVAAEDAPRRLVAQVLEREGRLDILVNNAGIADHGATHEFAEDRFRGMMAVNFDAVFRACQAALAPRLAQGEGVILNIGSIAGEISLVPQPQAIYSASKGAVHLLTRSLASDYATWGIRCNAIAPGYVTTDMTAGGLADPDMAPVWTDMTPMRRPGRPEEIAAAAVFLCSPAAYVTGAILPVDGGHLSR